VIRHSRPTIAPEDVEAVADVLRSGDLAQGERVEEFETAVARYLGRRGAVATSSGLSALHLALLVLDIGPGDAVLLPSYTCVALLHAVRSVDAVPQIVDIASGEYGIDPADVRRRLVPEARALIVPHMFGTPADLQPLTELGLPIIEDCAQALGASYRGRPAGSVGVLAVCSFYATKVITTGEGGLLLSDSDALLCRARALRDYNGRDADRLRFNYKMTDFQAALGLSQLRRLPSFVARRRALAARYTAALRHLPVALPAAGPGRSHIFYRYVVGVDGAARMAASLQERGIECKQPVPAPLHRRLGRHGFDRSDAAAATALSLPLYPSLSEEEVAAVVGAMTDVLERREEERRPASLRS
jgi:dTDP-4-amino-4,6-dideoxygalactose transaminase